MYEHGFDSERLYGEGGCYNSPNQVKEKASKAPKCVPEVSQVQSESEVKNGRLHCWNN